MERVTAGLARAKARGVKLGKPRSLSEGQLKELRALYNKGARQVDLASKFKISQGAVSTWVNRV